MTNPKLSDVMSEILDAVKNGPAERPTEKWMNAKLADTAAAARAWNQTAFAERWLNTISEAERITSVWIIKLHRNSGELASSFGDPVIERAFNDDLRLLDDLRHLESAAKFVPPPSAEQVREQAQRFEQAKAEELRLFEKLEAESEAAIAAMTEAILKRSTSETQPVSEHSETQQKSGRGKGKTKSKQAISAEKAICVHLRFEHFDVHGQVKSDTPIGVNETARKLKDPKSKLRGLSAPSLSRAFESLFGSHGAYEKLLKEDPEKLFEVLDGKIDGTKLKTDGNKTVSQKAVK